MVLDVLSWWRVSAHHMGVLEHLGDLWALAAHMCDAAW
jgi:hypothetical protein